MKCSDIENVEMMCVKSIMLYVTVFSKKAVMVMKDSISKFR